MHRELLPTTQYGCPHPKVLNRLQMLLVAKKGLLLVKKGPPLRGLGKLKHNRPARCNTVAMTNGTKSLTVSAAGAHLCKSTPGLPSLQQQHKQQPIDHDKQLFLQSMLPCSTLCRLLAPAERVQVNPIKVSGWTRGIHYGFNRLILGCPAHKAHLPGRPLSGGCCPWHWPAW